MSKKSHTTMSYIIGFVLSLVFTAIPYYLVVNQTVTGNVLLATILGFAVLQMIIQVVFFLHLGRGPKPLYNVGFFVATVGAILVVVAGSVYIMSHLHYNMTPTEKSKKLVEKEGIHQIEGQKTGACQGVHANHKVTIKGGKLAPLTITARLCDTLTFINEDDTTRYIAFGPHAQPKTYAGEGMLTLNKGRNKTITLSELGTYQLHDHLAPEVAGEFTVAP